MNTTKKITSKKEKYNRLVCELDKMITEPYYFKQYMPLKKRFEEDDWNIIDNLHFLRDKHEMGIPPISIGKQEPNWYHPNNPLYDDYIQQGIEAITTLLDKFVPEKDRVLSDGSVFKLEEVTEFLKNEENSNREVGSIFTCLLNEQLQVKKISLERDKNGKPSNHLPDDITLLWNVAPELEYMGEGLYEIVGTGERFDVGSEGVFIRYIESEVHSILKFNCTEEDSWGADYKVDSEANMQRKETIHFANYNIRS